MNEALAKTRALLREQLEIAVSSGDQVAILRLVHGNHPSDVAEALDILDFDQLTGVFRQVLMSDVSRCADMLTAFEPATIARLFPRLSQSEWSAILRELSDDDAVYVLELFPESARPHLVAKMPREDKEDILELLNYPEDSAGRIMTGEYLEVPTDVTVESVIEKIRRTRDIDPLNALFVYVTGKDGRLAGMVSLRQLLLSKKITKVGAIMRTDVNSVPVTMDQEDVAAIVSRHDDVTIPVVDEDNRILGIITVDDVIDVIEEESEEDFYKQIGSSEDEVLFKDNTRKVVWLRLPWILASFFGSLLVVLIMKYTESDIFKEDAGRIFIFVPMICAMGGNVGVQSSTIMARFLSHGHLGLNEARRTTIKEAKVGMALGIICGILIGAVSFFWGGFSLMFIVLLAMICTLTGAAITGTVIPILMKKLGFDPALATGPFVTSFNDLIAICVYFTIVYTVSAVAPF